MDIDTLFAKSQLYKRELDRKKAELAPAEFTWYPYGTLDNFYLLSQLLSPQHRNFLDDVGTEPIVDIGAADGDTAFFLESLGYRTHIADFAPTNFNSCRGMHLLKQTLGSQVEILETDLDAEFTLPAPHYELAFFLGILYHLKNPFMALECLAQHAKYAFISTRVTRYNVASGNEGADVNRNRVELSSAPVAYLVDADETNGDATNFWMFSEAGLRRILHRSGWDVLDFKTFGNTQQSDPATPNGDERAFCFVRSRYSGSPPPSALPYWSDLKRTSRRMLQRMIDSTPTEIGISTSHPNGHFYSPVVDPDEIDVDRTWPAEPEVLGIDFADASHEHILREVFPRFIRDYDYPEQLDETPELARFYTGNSQFGWLDSRTLFVLLREWQPRRLIEVGSGFSTLLAADVNQRFLDGRIDISCIEPFPREFLRNKIPGINRLIERKVQDVPLEEFERLAAGDVLFIDSSHVAKTGSDVNFLYFEVLPRLARGVRIHIHDIFLPHDYLRNWVIDENRSWNEQYLLRALLMHSNAFRVVFGCMNAYHRYPNLVSTALALPDGHAFGGSSFWIERV